MLTILNSRTTVLISNIMISKLCFRLIKPFDHYKSIMGIRCLSFKSVNKLVEAIVLTNQDSMPYLIRSLRVIHTNPAARKLMLVKMRSNLGDHLNWLSKWLWEASENTSIELPCVPQDDNTNAAVESFKCALHSVDRVRSYSILKGGDEANPNPGNSDNPTTREGDVSKLLNLLTSLRRPEKIESLSKLMGKYADDKINAKEFRTKLMRVCEEFPVLVTPILEILEIDITRKTKVALDNRLIKQVQLADELTAELQRFLDLSSTWRDEEVRRRETGVTGPGEHSGMDGMAKRSRLHCHHISMHCVLDLSRPLSHATLPPDRMLFLCNLHCETTASDIEDAMSRCGPVLWAFVKPPSVAEGSDHSRQGERNLGRTHVAPPSNPLEDFTTSDISSRKSKKQPKLRDILKVAPLCMCVRRVIV